VQAWRNGGLIMLEELDAGSNEACLALNGPLSSSFMTLPSGEVVPRHSDFRCIGAANTMGLGATAEYVGRTKLDGAFRNRFATTIFWGYDEALEIAISGHAEFARKVQRARKACDAKKIKVLITPRHSIAGAALLAAGFTLDEAANLTYLAMLSSDQRSQIGEV